MFIRLLVAFTFLIVLVQSAVTNSSKGQKADALTLPKQATLYDDYDLNDQKTLGNNAEGSGGAASLDEYADDEEEEQLSKVTATTFRSSISTTIATTTTLASTSTSATTTRRTTSTTTASNKWSKTTFNNYEQITKKKNQSSTTLSPAFNDLDASEFKDDQEEYADDLEDDAYYNEPTISNKVSPSSFPSTRYPTFTTRSSLPVNHTTPIWMLFTFLTRPPIAAGILAGKFLKIITDFVLKILLSRFSNRYFHIDHSPYLYYSTLS